MTDALLPRRAPDDVATLEDSQAVVEAYLAALADADLETAMALLDDDVLYVNVGLPAIRGREAMERVFGMLEQLQRRVRGVPARGDGRGLDGAHLSGPTSSSSAGGADPVLVWGRS
ncbi:MAG: nuclear transport factor 2 family protein [Acidimicrobiia bacterium]|nr:nuclear transport factor 2 family protein [Acidimicrobiia bacterium]